MYTNKSDNVVNDPYKAYDDLVLILGARNSPGIHMQKLAATGLQRVALRMGDT